MMNRTNPILDLPLSGQVEYYRAALQEITKGRGRHSRDPYEHAENTIDDMKQVAQDALEGTWELAYKDD